jgi:hypothetical protein
LQSRHREPLVTFGRRRHHRKSKAVPIAMIVCARPNIALVNPQKKVRAAMKSSKRRTGNFRELKLLASAKAVPAMQTKRSMPAGIKLQ